MDDKNLISFFKRLEPEFRAQVSNLSLQSDPGKVLSIVKNFLDQLLDSEGEYRQNLTQAEDYILESALSLLNAHNEIGKIVADVSYNSANEKGASESSVQQENRTITFESKSGTGIKTKQVLVNPANTLLATGSGAIAGKMLLNSWGGIIGALAGAALYLYKDTQKQQEYADNQCIKENTSSKTITVPMTMIDTNLLVSILEKICINIDNLIATYRAQIRRVVSKYESQEKPTLEKNYRILLEGIQTLIGYSRAHGSEDKFSRKIQERIEDISELLENYNLTVENYTPEHGHWFDLVNSPNTDTLKMAFPAIVKEGNAVIKGKVFIPDNK